MSVDRVLARFALIALVVPSSALAAAPVSGSAAKPIIRSQTDLPRHAYPVPTTATALLQADDATFNAWTAKVAADARALLANYQIDDRETRYQLLSVVLNHQLLTGQDQAALRTAQAIRDNEVKPDRKLVAGRREEAVARAHLATGELRGAAFDRAYADALRASLSPLPFAVVGTALRESKRNFEINAPSVLLGVVANEYEPEVKARRALSDDGASFLMRARLYTRVYWPTRAGPIGVLREIIAANTVVKPDIWAARELKLTKADRLTPVIAAVWDAGVDPAPFKGLMYRSPQKDAPNPYGLSFDADSRPTGGALAPLDARRQALYPTALADIGGMSDMEAAIDSPAAEATRARLAALDPADASRFMDDLDFFGEYTHGTHVAGIMARDNPAIRLAVIRHTFYAGLEPPPPSDAEVDRQVASYRAVSQWLKANRVRVVNMSWISTPGGWENSLERHNIGKDAADRKAIARRMFGRVRDAFIAVLADNPDTLFVSGAGNSNADNAFEEGYPSSVVAPNLIVANAVDQAGEETSFTSNGRNVAVSANGYLVNSFMPGGSVVARSGTSMASPQVANLAAKLIALDPALTPVAVIDLIRRGATASADGRIHTINPKASAQLLAKRTTR